MRGDLGFHYFLIYNVDLEHWCSRYGLEPYWGECGDCYNKLYVDQPFTSKTKRGLVATPCSCGSEHVPFSFIDLGDDEVSLNYPGRSVENSKVPTWQETPQKDHPKLRLVDI